MILHHQIHGMPGQENPAIVNAAYNPHIHCKNCFDKEAAKTSSNTKLEKTISESSNDSRNLSNSNNACDLTEHKGKSKCGRKRTTNDVEFRNRYTMKQRRITMFHCSCIKSNKSYKWDGSYELCNVMENIPKSNVCDAFQNVSIHCWNRRKFACNTNLMPLMPGPYSQYVFKYSHKGIQKEDSQTWDKVFTIIEKILAQPEET